MKKLFSLLFTVILLIILSSQCFASDLIFYENINELPSVGYNYNFVKLCVAGGLFILTGIILLFYFHLGNKGNNKRNRNH